MRKVVLILSAVIVVAVALYATGSASRKASARPLAGIDIRELTIKSHLEAGPNYSTM